MFTKSFCFVLCAIVDISTTQSFRWPRYHGKEVRGFWLNPYSCRMLSCAIQQEDWFPSMPVGIGLFATQNSFQKYKEMYEL